MNSPVIVPAKGHEHDVASAVDGFLSDRVQFPQENRQVGKGKD